MIRVLAACLAVRLAVELLVRAAADQPTADRPATEYRPRTGDVLVFAGRSRVDSWLVTMYAGSPWTHAGIMGDPQTVWHADTPGYSDPEGRRCRRGVQRVHVTQLLGAYRGVVAVIRPAYIDAPKLQAWLASLPAVDFERNVMALWRSTATGRAVVGPRSGPRTGWFCSEFVAHALAHVSALWDDVDPAYVAPGDLVEGHVWLQAVHLVGLFNCGNFSDTR